jgi:ABC-type multidrug transport system ATPase subunit
MIKTENLGKRYRFDWVFRGLSHEFKAGERTAILGPNGSGKSTLLKVLSGQHTPSKGSIQFFENQRVVPPEQVFRMVSFAAPYIDLIEELTLDEAIKFHVSLKPFFPEIKPAGLPALLQLESSRDKQLRFFSSGMRQRVKLALAICSKTPILLLDEPTTNLDLNAIEWYKNLVERFSPPSRTVVIASNDPVDVAFCPLALDILEFKKK